MKRHLSFQCRRDDLQDVSERPRIDRYLAQLDELELSRSRIQQLIGDGHVRLNGEAVTKKSRVRLDDRIDIHIPEAKHIEGLTPSAEGAAQLKVLFEDDDLLVINKAAGVVVHPGAGHHGSTLVEALMAHCQELSSIGGYYRPGIVHRLDRETSGVMVVAKNDRSHVALSEQFAQRQVNKIYQTLVIGAFQKRSGVIERPIGRHPVDRKRMTSKSGRGREALSVWEVDHQFTRFTLLRVMPKTGRTHQIRVHMHESGHPLVGDAVYGLKQWKSWLNQAPAMERNALQGLTRQALHAHSIRFSHPSDGSSVYFAAEMADDMRLAIERLLSSEAQEA